VIPRAQLYCWYQRYLRHGAGALRNGQSALRRVWNKLSETVAAAVIELALEEPELSPRELATVFVAQRQYFVSEASGYRAAEGAWPDYQPGFRSAQGFKPAD
jgi:hypothetical protein